MLIFKIKGIGWELSMMRINYKLTKRTTKTQKFQNFRKKFNIINFITIRYKTTASSNTIHSMLTYKLMRSVSILRLHKD